MRVKPIFDPAKTHIRPMRTALLPFAIATMLLSCSTATEKGAEADPRSTGAWLKGAITPDMAGAYYTGENSSVICKVGIMVDGSGIFAGPVPGPDMKEYRGTFTMEENKVRFSADSLQLDFTKEADRSLVYTGSEPALQGLVLRPN